MGLDLLPKTCPCGNHAGQRRIPEGFTHPKRKPCPFTDDNFPLGPVFNSCCWLRGKVAERELEALGEEDLMWRMREDLSHEEAIAFAGVLRQAADRLETQHRNDDPKPKGAGWDGRWDAQTKEFAWHSYSTFEEALASIREAAAWYERVGKLGFGVHAWY